MHSCTHCGNICPSIYPYTDAQDAEIFNRLRRNTFPSPTDAARLKSEITFLEGEIKDLSSLLDTLEHEKQQRERAKEIRQSLLSPIRRIPLEIWAEIFLYAIPEPLPFLDFKGNLISEVDSDITTMDSPWLLTHVSSYWRKLAISIPALWATVSLTPDLIPPQESLMRLQLDRSQDFPLHLQLRIEEYDSEDISRLRTLLFPLFHRCSTLELATPSAAIIENLCCHPAGLPSLRTLTIRRVSGVQPDNSKTHDENVSVFMKSLHLRAVNADFSLVELSLPLTTLRSLVRVPLATFEQIQGIVNAAPELEHLDFSFVEMGSGLSIPRCEGLPMITHNKLRRLRLSTTPSEILSCLKLPALRHLALEEGGFMNGRMETLFDFLRRSGCVLDDLTIMHTQDIFPLLRAVLEYSSHSLTRLAIIVPWVTAQDIYRLLTMTPESELVPNLQKLSIQDWPDHVPTGMTTFFGPGPNSLSFYEMVWSRRSRLNFVSLFSREIHVLTPDLEAHVSRLQDSGITVELFGFSFFTRRRIFP
ncbi:uncharacterized protein BT62DRAFT_995271 [Guyanagaster necrorhizus]|uniref:F-box domain-containing protein n=1 Tax=Guyanagaster necrorhizus TaxID=856835 RepID=A0A9P7VQM2_9AGAR|nr:uncharacterized protein BT62DRAFT_995271 [Guyanagaster necrorhizus MCA 3950]KAG7444807.1 hypothetical protein BT62DRAFT_995271 [Guyanagaster necrorhizus MCA 3950]